VSAALAATAGQTMNLSTIKDTLAAINQIAKFPLPGIVCP